ncbi:class A beta-lactamase-related serine hydrolase [Mesorhizobium sp. M1A.T.Ca.IN.004.03.1.1]|uniref:serine hydrolase domain-containing protein n=1 Tax=Mesorhizobium sp. M1A.T.Ca.IN.004.03.1.1 TaxID=2496795 RepID=UPI000FC99D1E|nr:serine hydrolase domain-containing protein [Mesorhizobium sp. M1A.T.Ca.IN.004.03.1.1]RUV40492.1 class A beta-lactamase-related serine hydrolase [Mesorhizobium sp. M1A.T.Ca.IN.004.03.1.1]
MDKHSYENNDQASGANRPTSPRSLIEWLQSHEFSEFIRAQMQASHIPGLSLAIIDQGSLVYTAGFGLADIALGRAMTPQTLLNIGSITKTITCTAVMQMYEQEKLELDVPIDQYLPFTVRNPAFSDRPITTRQLLTHTSSIADSPLFWSNYGCGDPQATLRDWLQQYFTTGGSFFDPKRNFNAWAPGSMYQYCNVTYGLLGLIVERLSDMSYPDYCREHIFAPLGMTDARFLLEGMPREKHATLYDYVDDGDVTKVQMIDPEWSAPAGQKKMHVPHCLYSYVTLSDGLARTTASELARFLMVYMQDGVMEGKRILRAETIKKVLSDQYVQSMPCSKQIQGLTWYQNDGIKPYAGTARRSMHGVWGHSGSDPGVSTYMGFRPTDGRGVVLLANLGGNPPARPEIVERIFGLAGDKR